jgi:hypothetical protein
MMAHVKSLGVVTAEHADYIVEQRLVVAQCAGQVPGYSSPIRQLVASPTGGRVVAAAHPADVGEEGL